MRLVTFLEQAVRHAAREIEIYSAFAVCLTLLAIEIFHKTSQEAIGSAILIVLMLIVIGALKDRNNIEKVWRGISSLQEHLDQRTEGTDIRWYARRREAESDMLSDMEKYSFIVFIGVSQRTLATYLRDVLANTNDGRILPWRSFRIFFASSQIGEIYEGPAYYQNASAARLELAFLLTDPRWSARIPQFEGIQFREYDRFLGYSGSMFASQASALNSGEFEITYVVHSRLLRSELRDGLTIRLEAAAKGGAGASHQARVQHYSELYRSLNGNSASLGSFKRSLWDDSAQQWSHYAKSSRVLKESMAKLVDLAELGKVEQILELGSGSGESSEILVNAAASCRFVLLDGSPQMLRIACERFEHVGNVKTVMCVIPEEGAIALGLDDEAFTLLVMHQSFPDMVASFNTIDRLSAWCRRRLKTGGRVVIQAHNTVVETKPPPRFENWLDPFLPALMEEFKRHREIRVKELERRLFKVEDIQKAFEYQRFKTVSKYVSSPSELSMEERQQMWRVPAILDTIVDFRRSNLDVLMDILERVAAQTRSQETMPRTSTYLIFEAI